MARKKSEKKELTVEERLLQEKERGLSDILFELPFINEPSYRFNVGDEVRFGAMKKSVVDEVLYDGKVYGLRCTATNNNYGHPYDYETYRVTMWTNVRPIQFGTTCFTKNKDIKLYFNNSTIESIIHKYYSFGIDMEPDYQRGYVWEENDKEFLIDSIFNNIDIGKFVLIRVDRAGVYDELYEILDGKQRLSTIIEFFENKLAYKGKYYNDLSGEDKNTFKEHNISIAEVNRCDKASVLKYFLMLNRSGKSMDQKHLDNVQNMLNELE